MRIVNRETFLSLPAGTVYAKWGDADGKPNDFTYGEVSVKGETCMGVDFVDEPLLAWPEGVTDSGTLFDAWEKAAAGEETTPMMIGDCGCRDGLFDDKQRFAVYSKVEVERLLDLLTWAHENAYSSIE